MAMQKQQKVQLVNKLRKEMATYKTVAVMPINSVPDRLLQKVRNQFKDGKVVVAKKTLIKRVLDKTKYSVLEPLIVDNVALVMSNKDPTELYKEIASNKLKLGAKPGQIAPSDIQIVSGETGIAPGQAVTELKSAEIDVKIQNGKVVISKDKVIVEKGKKISKAVANALKLLDVMPFEAATTLNAAFSENLIFNKEVLSMDEAAVRNQLAKAFAIADSLSTEIGLVTEYNVNSFVVKAYRGAYAIGETAKIPEPEFIAMTVGQAAADANALSGVVNAGAPVDAAAAEKKE